MPARQIFTIGHSNHPLDYFLELLRCYEVNCLVDVRSVPASKYNPQYNKVPLRAHLLEQGITYIHMAEAFGAKQTAPEVLNEQGQVDFEKVRATVKFKEGIERLVRGTDMGYNIALMCAESKPLECHRFSMITPALVHEGFDIRHILGDQQSASQQELEALLLKKYAQQLAQTSLFPQGQPYSKISFAYILHNKEVGYKP